MKRQIRKKGSVLLVVLFIVICVSFLSMGFLSRSDSELYCGDNMILRTEMDYLCQTGLSFGRAMVLNTGFIFPTSLSRQPTPPGSDNYYDLTIGLAVASPADPNYTHTIDCDAYKEVDGVKIGLTSMQGQLHYNSADGRAYFKSIKRQ